MGGGVGERIDHLFARAAEGMLARRPSSGHPRTLAHVLEPVVLSNMEAGGLARGFELDVAVAVPTRTWWTVSTMDHVP